MSSDIVSQLQLLRQNLESLHERKNILQEQFVEVESAKKHVTENSKSYKIVGKLLIAQDSNKLVDELKQDEDSIKLEIDQIEEQEKNIANKMQSLQEDLMKGMD